MTLLDSWLKQATRHLSRDSAAQVRVEIQEHFESGLEAAMGRGASRQEAEQRAVAALGLAKAANRQYRMVMLTSGEARMLREGNWEARAVCSNPWLKRILLGAPVAALLLGAALFFSGATGAARVLLLCGITMGLLLAAPFLPIYTPVRGRVYRFTKFVVLVGALGLAFGSDALKYSWLLATCLWILVWLEWTRISIRRKLPVAKWPKQLHL
jgi:hypothetical protein